MDTETRWREMAPGSTAWAELRAPVHPRLGERNPLATSWREYPVDPDLVGLVPGWPRPAHIEIGHPQDCPDPWTLPIAGVLATPLAWHPRLPLVAGLAARGYHAHPWIADYRTRTVALHEDVRAATSLTDGRTPLIWCGDRHLALLTPPPGALPGHPPRRTHPVILEAEGPGFLSFLPEPRRLHELAAASVSTFDIIEKTLIGRTDPLLVFDLRLADTGNELDVEHTGDELSDVFDRRTTRVELGLASPPFRSCLGETDMAVHRDLRCDARPHARMSQHEVGTGLLGWDPDEDHAGPVTLWLQVSESGSDTVSVAPESVTATGFPFAVLDLRLHWPLDATVETLHDQIVGPVRSALGVLGRPVVIGGHSFGATIALYALAHVPELAAAIVHSGCYNRTLTPAGFHWEKRSYWDAPDIYQAFSALHFADRLTRPVLIVHGSEDLNLSTTPEQAVEFYRAIVAAGGHARLLLFPDEGHTFQYRETQENLVGEHREWLRRWSPT